MGTRSSFGLYFMFPVLAIWAKMFVLTSSTTFSSAKEFTYNLKNLKRATIIGEKTCGGAHPARRYRINERFTAIVPIGRAINPITGNNWEGVGVMPDIEAPAELALSTAHLMALKRAFRNKDRPTNSR